MIKLCTQCFFIGQEARNSQGSFKAESTIWGAAFLFAALGVFYSELWFPATIIFFVALLYTMTRFKIKPCVCPRCGKPSMIPLDSPKASQIIHDNNIIEPYNIQEQKPAIFGIPFRGIMLLLTTILIAIILYNHFR